MANDLPKKDVLEVPVDLNAEIEITSQSSVYILTKPNDNGWRSITVTKKGRVVDQRRGKIYGVAVDDSKRRLGHRVEDPHRKEGQPADTRWIDQTTMIKTGDYVVFLREGEEYDITSKVVRISVSE
ncbi:MAG: hypothetical protein WC289_02650 [Patescibacteria group bacterium]|jgi:hypothetical protein